MGEIEEINKKLNIVYQIDKKVAVIEEHLRNQNGVIQGIINDLEESKEDLYGKVNANTNFRFWLMGGAAGISALIYYIFKILVG